MTLTLVATLLLMLGLFLYMLSAVSSVRSATAGAWLALVGSGILFILTVLGLF